MKLKIIIILFTVFYAQLSNSQDTFSIVAVDSITGEVGSAGASCVDLFQFGLPTDDFLGQLIPGVGAINTQAYYVPTNQTNATTRMNLGETPSEIINWLVRNDVSSQPQLRQYGITALVDRSPEAAAHTGASTDNYKNHIVGPNYSIQGNILLGQEVLDMMEYRFLNEPGDLACKLMAALQGANMIGADSRCNSNGTSSLFAFLKVAQPTDIFGNPSFKVSVRTRNNSRIEPIDSLQTKFDIAHNCDIVNYTETIELDKYFSIYPNPSSYYITIDNKTDEKYNLYLFDILGKLVFQDTLNKMRVINISKYERGSYFLRIVNHNNTFVQKLMIE